MYLVRPKILSAQSTGKLDLDDIDQAWACVASNAIKKMGDDYEQLVKGGTSKEMAMEAVSQGRFLAAKVCTI